MKLFKYFDPNRGGTDYVVGDIHGHFSELEKLLKEIGFNPETDRLFVVGDLVDRGPESHRVEEFLAKPWFHSVRGNHEQMILSRDLSDYDRVANGQQWFMCLPTQEQQEVRLALGTLPVAIQVGNVGIVHAEVPGYDWDKFVTNLTDWNRRCVMHAIWDRARWEYGGEGVPPVQGILHVIVGHTPDHEIQRHYNVINVDTGSGKGGKLTILSLKTFLPVGEISTIRESMV